MEDKKLVEMLSKRSQAQKIMRELGVPVWVTIVADNGAEKAHLPLIGAPSGHSPRAYILTPDRAVAVSYNIEALIQERHGFETILAKGGNLMGDVAKVLLDITGGEGVPIALNYSYEFASVDTLGYGIYKKLGKELDKVNYFSKKERFTSADELILVLASTKLPHEVDMLREAAQITNDVLVESFEIIKSGMTEKDVAGLVHKIVDERILGDKRIGYSWEKEGNPIVLVGEGIAGSPHMNPSDRILKGGDTVYIDFGLSVNGYPGDLQNFGYVLGEGEVEAPAKIQDMLRLLSDSVNAGMKVAKPDAKGWHVDKASRDVIVNAGYPTYKHSTGHQLGADCVHAPGVSFGPKYDDYSNEGDDKGKERVLSSRLLIKEGYVMTIEPRIQIANGASIEVDGIVVSDGFELFVPMQDKVHLIK